MRLQRALHRPSALPNSWGVHQLRPSQQRQARSWLALATMVHALFPGAEKTHSRRPPLSLAAACVWREASRANARHPYNKKAASAQPTCRQPGPHSGRRDDGSDGDERSNDDQQRPGPTTAALDDRPRAARLIPRRQLGRRIHGPCGPPQPP